ncbi:AbiH family protein [Aestuariibaculum lutulentum]|uniref:Bacteriophage abortive infection AbiH family protein n=1 Tax=Aestuariibaculum lutulentum TaxID=2920935 RepID=A0ABS9RGA6_9FLAO|nr:AbiH family protein [Aestuariibaculum lutulentum]MCH4551983.1 bacteriophage abortive infection AbiH family protein [Aestuariibaculum lutulentum]
MALYRTSVLKQFKLKEKPKKLDLSKKILQVNKLILIGNGFDLALGLKTKYEDFLLWLLKKYIVQALESGEQNAPFDKYPGMYNEIYRKRDFRKVYGYSENNLFDVLFNTSYRLDKNEILQKENLKDLNDLLGKFKIEIAIHNKNGLFEEILKDSNLRWVDVEGSYFKIMKEVINRSRKFPDNYIDVLNSDLEKIKGYLREYLKELDYSISEDLNVATKYYSQFIQGIKRAELTEVAKKSEVIKTENLLFLNFNYTNSLSNVINKSRSEFYFNGNINIKEWRIHGSLTGEINSMVFGYGDEMDSDYKKIEELNDNRFFRGIKSFKYSENSKYRDLLRFLYSEDYQVCVYGHSCGLSDRLMLNEIFEHENCKSIKIFYYDKTEFVNKTMDISRHFKNNQIMRQRIVEFNEEDQIPQVKNS